MIKIFIKVLGSSSLGNSYILGDDKEKLIIDCGLPLKKILEGLNYNISNVLGCLVTHEHMDHIKSATKLSKKGIDIFTSKGTSLTIENNIENHRLHIIESEKQFKIGNFTIMPFEVQHDSREPLGFIIYHQKLGTLLFATDTYYIKYKFNNLNHIFIECNYKESILVENLEKSKVSRHLLNRITQSHFELDNVKTFFKFNDLSKVKNICLIHLSNENSDSELFKNEIMKITGKPVYIAKENLIINLDI